VAQPRNTKFQTLKRQLLAARAQTAELNPWGPDPKVDPEGARNWRRCSDAASESEREALFGLRCLCPVDASAAELVEACEICEIDVEKSLDDLAFWARGTLRLERSEWSIGQEVEVTGPMRMADRDGDPMVMGHDAITGCKGRITGMTPDGLYIYMTGLGDCEDVCIGRVRALP